MKRKTNGIPAVAWFAGRSFAGRIDVDVTANGMTVSLKEDHVPGREPVFCKYCCRMLRWFLNPREAQKPGEGRIWQAVCCDRPYYEREVLDGGRS
jgi:hypothetical protein